MCAFSIKDEPPPEPRKTPTTEGRPTTGSTTETSRPASRSHDATNPAIAASPSPDGTRSGFTEGIATSAQISSSSSSRTVHPKHMQTIEREAEPTPAAKPTGPRQFQPKEIFKQAVISSLAVAPDASSIVYVKRTVDDGKYVRRLWRTTFKGGRPDQLTSVWIVETATGKTKRITAPTYNVESAAWSPDGKHIAFVADMTPEAALEETPKVWTLPVNGNGAKPTQIAQLQGAVFAVAW